MPQGGEKPGYREAMDRMTKQMVDAGASPEKARQVVQQQAIKADREGRKAKG